MAAPSPISPDPSVAALALTLADEAATRRLARVLAALARVGDVIGLAGDLGAGKTTLARAFIRALTVPSADVPSPTFTLVQAYDGKSGTIHHFDLYRLDAAEDAWELGIEEAFADGISLIEWPERLGPLLPAQALIVTLTSMVSAGARRAVLAGGGAWRTRLDGVRLEAADG